MNDFIFPGDEELMQEIKAGSMLAFDILYKKYSKQIYRFSYSILKSQEETENLLQDVYLNLWENRFKVEKDSSIKYYLFTVAYNSAISIIRKKTKEAKYIKYINSLPKNDEAPVNTKIEYDEMENRVNEIINELPRRQKEIYLLHRVAGLKYKEIAEKLNITTNTVENHMARALKTIRTKFNNYALIAILFRSLFI